MKTIRSSVATALALLLSLSIFSFTSNKGGEGFEISLNGKVVLQQFGGQLNNLKSIQLDQNSANDELTVKYWHCGQVGKNRTITVKDANNKTLKEWHFVDVAKGGAAMTCKVKDIVGLNKAKGSITLNLYYASSELPKGRQLASLVVYTPSMAKL